MAKKKYRKSAARTQAIKEYRKQRKRVLQAARRERQKGKDVSTLEFPKLDTASSTVREIKKAIKKLANILPSTIRVMIEKAAEERKELQTARKKPEQEKRERESPTYPTPNNEEGFEERQGKKDEENRKRMEKDKEFRKKFNMGQIIYRKMLDMIEDAGKYGKYWGQNYLKSLLDREIDTYGFDAVMVSISNADGSAILQNAEIACYASDQYLVNGSISAIASIIEGNLPDVDEMKELEEVEEMDDFDWM